MYGSDVITSLSDDAEPNASAGATCFRNFRHRKNWLQAPQASYLTFFFSFAHSATNFRVAVIMRRIFWRIANQDKPCHIDLNRLAQKALVTLTAITAHQTP
jgi:hypothetical protein